MIDIATQRIGTTTVLALRGRMDSTSKHTLMNVIERELALAGRELALDLSNVNYISTSGLKVLRTLKEKAGKVSIITPSARVSEVLQITGLNHIYKIYESPVQAFREIAPVVNAHTRLEYGWLEDYRPNNAGMPFAQWMTDTVSPALKLVSMRREELSQQSVERGIQTLLQSGTTAVYDVTSMGNSIQPLFDSGLEGIVYVELMGTQKEIAQARFKRARELIDEWRPKEQRGGMRIGISMHAPYSLDPDLWHDALDYVRDENLPLCIHAAESPAEFEFFMHGTGPMLELQKRLGAGIDSPKISPIHYLYNIGALDMRPLLAHAVHVTDEDITRIFKSEASVVHCPRSNLRLKCGRMPLEKYLDANIPVYLGTDSLGTSPSLDVLDELEVAVALHHGKVTPEQIMAMVHRVPLIR